MKRALMAASVLAVFASTQALAQTVGVGPAGTLIVEPEQRTVIKEYVVKAYLRPVLCAVPVAVMAYGFSLMAGSSWVAFAAEVAAMSGVFGLLSYFVCLQSEQRAVVTARVWALLRPAPAAN